MVTPDVISVPHMGAAGSNPHDACVNVVVMDAPLQICDIVIAFDWYCIEVMRPPVAGAVGL